MSDTPLTPLSFLERSADVWASRPAVDDWSYAEHFERVRRLAGALHDELGVSEGDRVAALLPNLSALLELHYAVPGVGAVLVPLNTRLSAPDYDYILEHSGASVVLASTAFRDVLADAVWVEDDYDALLDAAAPRDLLHPADERALLSINYTSGTTGRPKGVMTSHRGAYLHSSRRDRRGRPERAQRLPLDAAHVPLQWLGLHVGGHRRRGAPPVPARSSTRAAIWQALLQDGVTHLCAAPTVVTMLLESERAAPLHRARAAVRRRRPALPDAARARRGAEHRRHPPLRSDRDLRPVRRLRLAPRVGRAARREQARLRARQGVATWCASRCVSSISRCATSRATARRSARS